MRCRCCCNSQQLGTSFLIFITTTLVHYIGCRHNGLTLDDKHTLLSNPLIQSPTFPSYQNLLTSDYWGQVLDERSHQSFRPITTVSFWIDAGGAPASDLSIYRLHRTNILLHAICAVLIEQVALKHGASINNAVLASLFFAVHPVVTEAVANISGRAELLGCCFGLLYYLLFTSWDMNKQVRYSLGVILSLLATFSKESGYASTIIVSVYCWLKWKRNNSNNNNTHRWTRLTDEAPVATAIVAIVGAVRLQFLKANVFGGSQPLFTAIDNPLTNASLSSPSLLMSTAYINVKSLSLLLNPLGSTLCPDYSGPACPIITEVQDYRNFTTVVVLGVLFVFCYICVERFRRKNSPNTVTGIVLVLWWLVPMSIASNVFFHVGFCIAERTLYTPLIGIVLLVFLIVLPQCQRLLIYVESCQIDIFIHPTRINLTMFKRTVRWLFNGMGVALVVLFIAMTKRTVEREHVWSSNFHLWSHAEQECVGTSRVMNNLGKAYQRMGKNELSKIHLKQAIALDPSSNLPHFNLGMIAQKENDCATALTHYTKSIQLHPLHVASYNNMGACALQMGHRTKAVDYLQKACELDPTNEGAKRNLKQALGQ